MKNAFLFFISILFFGSCDSTAQQTESKTVEKSSPAVEEIKTAFVDINVEQFKKMMNEPDVVILDVRTSDETAQGKIEGAIEIDVFDPAFEQKVQELDKSKTYLVYCAAGKRSAKSCGMMANLGFEKLYNLEGGYSDWSESQ